GSRWPRGYGCGQRPLRTRPFAAKVSSVALPGPTPGGPAPGYPVVPPLPPASAIPETDMFSLGALWIPIVLSALVVFFASFLINAVLPYHRADLAPVPNENEFMAKMRAANLP